MQENTVKTKQMQLKVKTIKKSLKELKRLNNKK